MSVMLICTLGARDLLLDNEPIKPPREKGKKILDDFGKYYSRLSYPIIRPAFKYIFSDRKYEKIDRLILIATDQDENNKNKIYRANDTIEFARILKMAIEKSYGNRRVSQIKIVKITQNPNFIDDMYVFFGKSLASNKSFKMEKLDTCFVEQTGGIPSANMALLFQCINKFEEKCSPVYISEKNKCAIPIKFTDAILTDKRKALLHELASKFDYALLCDHLDGSKENEKFLYRLSQYAQHRLYFDTSTAQSIARQSMGEFLSYERNIFEDLLMDLNKIEQKDYVKLITELYYNIIIKYSQKEFVDFSGRIYRFKEAVLRYLFEKNTGLSTDIDIKRTDRLNFFNLLRNILICENFLLQKKHTKGRRLIYRVLDCRCYQVV